MYSRVNPVYSEWTDDDGVFHCAWSFDPKLECHYAMSDEQQSVMKVVKEDLKDIIKEQVTAGMNDMAGDIINQMFEPMMDRKPYPVEVFVHNGVQYLPLRNMNLQVALVSYDTLYHLQRFGRCSKPISKLPFQTKPEERI